MGQRRIAMRPPPVPDLGIIVENLGREQEGRPPIRNEPTIRGPMRQSVRVTRAVQRLASLLYGDTPEEQAQAMAADSVNPLMAVAGPVVRGGKGLMKLLAKGDSPGGGGRPELPVRANWEFGGGDPERWRDPRWGKQRKRRGVFASDEYKAQPPPKPAALPEEAVPIPARSGSGQLGEPIPFPEQAQQAFSELADYYRDAPATALYGAKKAYGEGVLIDVLEHAGDLPYRMSSRANRGVAGLEHGRREVLSGAQKALEALEPANEFSRQMAMDLQATARARGEFGPVVRDELAQAMNRFGLATSRGPAYNRPQYLAREATSALARMEFDIARQRLRELIQLAGDPDLYTRALANYGPGFQK